MKQKIAIFGDSYAEMYTDLPQRENLNSLSWPVLLMKKENWNVDNYAKSGSSVFYSFDKFKSNYRRYDTIIFIVTDSARLYIDNDKIFAPSLSSIEETLKKYIFPGDPVYQTYKAAEQYYTFLYSAKLHTFVRDSVIEHVGDMCKRMKKKLIMIPGIGLDELVLRASNNFKCSLSDVTKKELVVQFGCPAFRPETSKRPCHLSKENNVILADLLARIINGEDLKIGMNDFKYEKVDDPELYWRI